jgi:hypothetical protein
MKLAARNLDAAPQLGRDFQAVDVYVSQLALKRLPLHLRATTTMGQTSSAPLSKTTTTTA